MSNIIVDISTDDEPYDADLERALALSREEAINQHQARQLQQQQQHQQRSERRPESTTEMTTVERDWDYSAIAHIIEPLKTEITFKLEDRFGVSVSFAEVQKIVISSFIEELVTNTIQFLDSIIEDPENIRHIVPVLTASVDIPSNLGGVIIGKGGSTLRYLEREIGCKIKLSRGAEVTAFTGSSIVPEVLEVFTNRLESIRADPTAFTAHMKALLDKKIHVFVDVSNIMIGCQYISPSHSPTSAVTKDSSLRIRVEQLVEIIKGGRQMEHGVVVGSTPASSSPFWDRWRESGFEVTVFNKVVDTATNRAVEQGVDDTLQSLMGKDIMKQFSTPRTLILLTGDGNENYGRVTFPEQVEAAIRNGWNVEVWSWAACTKGIYRDLHSAYPSRVSLFELDRFRSEIVYRQQSPGTGTGTGAAVSAAVDHDPSHGRGGGRGRGNGISGGRGRKAGRTGAK